MIVPTSTETWLAPDGRHAVATIEHHPGGDVVPVVYDLFSQMLTDLGYAPLKDEPTA